MLASHRSEYNGRIEEALRTLQNTESRTLRRTTCTPGIPPHGHGLLVFFDVLEVAQGFLEVPAVDGLGGFAGVLEGDAQVGAAAAGGFGGFDGVASVADLRMIC